MEPHSREATSVPRKWWVLPSAEASPLLALSLKTCHCKLGASQHSAPAAINREREKEVKVAVYKEFFLWCQTG